MLYSDCAYLDSFTIEHFVCLCVEDSGCEASVAKILAAGSYHHVLLQRHLPLHRRCQVELCTNTLDIFICTNHAYIWNETIINFNGLIFILLCYVQGDTFVTELCYVGSHSKIHGLKARNVFFFSPHHVPFNMHSHTSFSCPASSFRINTMVTARRRRPTLQGRSTTARWSSQPVSAYS